MNKFIGALLATLLAGAALAQEMEVAPLSENGSDEQIKSEASSGFDTPGAFAIPEDDYNPGVNEDGWAPEMPEIPEPTRMDEQNSASEDNQQNNENTE